MQPHDKSIKVISDATDKNVTQLEKGEELGPFNIGIEHHHFVWSETHEAAVQT